MRRWLTRRAMVKVLLFAAGGAIVNVAVAWGCARLAPNPFAGRLLSVAQQDALWDRYADHAWPTNAKTGVRGAHWPGLAISYLEVSSGGFDVDSQQHAWKKSFPEVGVQIERAGFPLHSVETGEAVSIAGMIQQARSNYQFPTSRRTLWPGFAINTVFYAAVLWAVLFGPGKIRRFIRARRGQCPACGYPVGTSEVCTECGARLPSPSR